jgi:hypothetical protein
LVLDCAAVVNGFTRERPRSLMTKAGESTPDADFFYDPSRGKPFKNLATNFVAVRDLPNAATSSFKDGPNA